MSDHSEFRRISETFPGLKLPAKLEDIDREARVAQLALDKADEVLHIRLLSHHIIPKEDVLSLEEEIKRRMFAKESVEIQIDEQFELSSQYTPEGILAEYRPSMLLELKRRGNLLAALFDAAELFFRNPGELCIRMEDSVISRRQGDELVLYLMRLFRDRFGMRISVAAEHVNSREEEDGVAKDGAAAEENSGVAPAPEEELHKLDQENRPLLQEDEEEDGRPDSNMPRTRAKRGERRPRAKTKAKENDPDAIYRRSFEIEPTPICDIDDMTREAVVRGQIIKIETRELVSKRTNEPFVLVAFSVTDFTDSMQGKLFLAPEEWEEMEAHFCVGDFVLIHAQIDFDSYTHEQGLARIFGIMKSADFREAREDKAAQKRVELHCHTKMSDMDGVADVGDLIRRAYAWGHPAIAVTDHGGVQGFPEAHKALGKLDKAFRENYAKAYPEVSKEEIASMHAPFKVIYGEEAYLVDDQKGVATNSRGQKLEGNFVVFDIETTGLSNQSCKIIEIGAVRVEGGEITERFSSFVNPEVPIPLHIENLTSINDRMVMGAPKIEEVLPKFLDFCRGAVLVAHNADFDMGFIEHESARLGLPCEFTYVDTVGTARFLLPGLSRFRLDNVAKAVNVPLEHHHRAVDDAACTAGIFRKFTEMLAAKGITDLDALNREASLSKETVRKLPSHHVILLAQNEIGRVNLYRLVSASHLDYIHTAGGAPRAKLPKSLIDTYREGILVGSACEAGELYQALLRGASDAEIARIVAFYDYLEIQPLGNNRFLIDKEGEERVKSEEDLKDLNREIVRLGEQFGKPVVATGDVHFLNPEDELYRRIIQAGKKFKDADAQGPLYLHTTEEMLAEFDYLDPAKAVEVVITNPRRIADACERISPIRDGKFPPKIENSDQDLRDSCYAKAHEIYGDPLPEPVQKRLERELSSIIDNDYAVLYIIAQKLVKRSNEDGYLVGSRGSVGSSFAATMAGITEVNPLPPHYLCPNCHYADFDSPAVKTAAGDGLVGVDLDDAVCPHCGTPLKKLGFNIPFETFLGFAGNKEPDIDLNFSGEYQARAHKYAEEIFGEGQTFRAGTIGTMAERTAFGFVKKYFEERGLYKRGAEIDRVVKGCVGVRRTSGQHPGGIIVLPHGEDINSFTPIQYPADKPESGVITTHFDYHSIDKNLLKLDLLGHDDPTMIRLLEQYTGTNAREIPLDEPAVMSLFKSPAALGITSDDISGCPLGCLGVPEFGTNNVIQMLVETEPKNFSDLIRISGLSHGTNVWHGNAQEFIKAGTCTLSEAICTRDDIMTYLIHKGLEPELSFNIMERVRKGNGVKKEWAEEMTGHKVPDWYIDSCNRIEYMFPKAHAVAYVMMAYRIAWYKIYHPLAYYAAYFSIRASGFDYEKMCLGPERLQEHLRDFRDRSRRGELKEQEKDILRDMRLVEEMYARGITFLPVDLYKSEPHRFRIIGNQLLPALDTIDGLDKAADELSAAAAEGVFISKADLRRRARVNEKILATLDRLGILAGLPDTDQISLFDIGNEQAEAEGN